MASVNGTGAGSGHMHVCGSASQIFAQIEGTPIAFGEYSVPELLQEHDHGSKCGVLSWEPARPKVPTNIGLVHAVASHRRDPDSAGEHAGQLSGRLLGCLAGPSAWANTIEPRGVPDKEELGLLPIAGGEHVVSRNIGT